MENQQLSSNVVMIRPATFCFNEQTAATNRFQSTGDKTADIAKAAKDEFDRLANALRDANVGVHIFDATAEPNTPDAIFPNNWVTFHSDGTAVLYPMLAPNRRIERRMDILTALKELFHFKLHRVVDLTHWERADQYLEGTGSLVLDRANRVAYACNSSRTHASPLKEFASLLGYEIVAFDAVDRQESPIYHTNVMMSIGRNFAVVCCDAIAVGQRELVMKSLRCANREIIEINQRQLEGFAGNILELATNDGDSIVALSARARDAFTSEQRTQLTTLAGSLVSADVSTIETLGGGSVRCMLAEIHLPRATT